MATGFKMEPLDVEGFVKANDVQEITDPVFFVKNGVPTSEGLLSNDIFGITKEERANIFGYIDLGGWYLHPLVYKIWSRMDSRVKEIVHGTDTYRIGADGDFIKDPTGDSGVEFLKKNIEKIKIKSTGSRKREKNIQFLEKYKKNMFMKKLVVIPPFYRDVDTKQGGAIGVGVLNKFYSAVIVSVRSLNETKDYGLSLSDAVSGKVQELLLNIYNALCGTDDSLDAGPGLGKKYGLIRSTVMSKTSDYGTRLVLSAHDLKVESLDDIMVDMEYSALPLAAAITVFQPFVVYNMKRFFENEFGGVAKHQVMDKDGKVTFAEVKDPLIQFSEDTIKKEIKRFIHGYSNRLSPVEVELVNGRKAFMIFKGRSVRGVDVANKEAVGASPLIDRHLTWTDILYMAACQAVENRHVLLTRFPIDSAYNQMITKVRISTLRDTEPVFINNTYYRWYPKFRQKDVGSNTRSSFIDTLQMTNLLLKGAGADYDGDQASVKGVFTDEANKELDKHIKSKLNYIDISGNNIRVSTNEAVQSLYNLTLILPDDKTKMTSPTY